jgi:tryptophan synthase alpha chain
MNRYQQTFERTQRENRIAFIPFAVAGDPDMALSEQVLRAYLEAGADILEIGYPFSDPTADGPVNQRAAQRAIKAGVSHARFFAMLKRLRAESAVPFGLLLYANSIHHLGPEAFCARAAAAGVDSLLVADMPPEEARPLLTRMRANGLQSVFIVSELTHEDRIRFISDHTDGFLYVVSRLGTTGVSAEFSHSVNDTIERIRRLTDLPLCVGFGVSTPEHVQAVRKAGADGAIVGSKLVSIIEKRSADPPKMLRSLKRAVRSFVKSTAGQQAL